MFLFRACFADPKKRNKLRDSKTYVAIVDLFTVICAVSFASEFVGKSYEIFDICTGTTQKKSVDSGGGSEWREFRIS